MSAAEGGPYPGSVAWYVPVAKETYNEDIVYKASFGRAFGVLPPKARLLAAKKVGHVR